MNGAVLAEPQNETQTAAGFECPRCGCPRHRVLETRKRPRFIYRRRLCLNHLCGSVFSSTERVNGEPRPPRDHI